MRNWRRGIGRLNGNAEINFNFCTGFTTPCDNPQLFRTLGIYDLIERDILRAYPGLNMKHWGVPIKSVRRGLFNRAQRPVVTVLTDVETEDVDTGKTIILQNFGKEPIVQNLKICTSSSEFKETVIDLSSSIEFNQNTNVTVASESSRFIATFSSTSSKKVTKSYSQETETCFKISTGEQLVRIKNPTQITKFKVRVVGKFCIRCNRLYHGHRLWMPQLNKIYGCQVVSKDVGATSWRVERLSEHPVNVNFKEVGAG